MLPVPHAYGLCDDPYALVMDRLPGQVDLSFAPTTRARAPARRLPRDARPHLRHPALRGRRRRVRRPRRLGGDGARRVTGAGWRRSTTRRWRVCPSIRSRCSSGGGCATTSRRTGYAAARFITYDSFQFMFEDGRITGLLDFEHAHVGDPMMDLAALRVRDTIKNIGELSDTGGAVRGDHRHRRSTTTWSSTTPSSTTRSR